MLLLDFNESKHILPFRRKNFLCVENPIIYLQTQRTCNYYGFGKLILVNLFGYIPTIYVH